MPFCLSMDPSSAQASRAGGARLPLTNVTWGEARLLAGALGGCRLPRAVERECAARGSSGRRYPWGDVWADGVANTAEGADGQNGGT